MTWSFAKGIPLRWNGRLRILICYPAVCAPEIFWHSIPGLKLVYQLEDLLLENAFVRDSYRYQLYTTNGVKSATEKTGIDHVDSYKFSSVSVTKLPLFSTVLPKQ